MFGVDDAILAAGVSALGNAASGWFGSNAQKDANAQNLQIAREQMAFQERMSSTAYQRGMADMRAAGLNPILAYQKGGASAPAGASANMLAANPLPGNPMGEFVNTAMSLRLKAQELQNTQATFDNIKAENSRILSQAAQAGNSAAKIAQDMKIGNPDAVIADKASKLAAGVMGTVAAGNRVIGPAITTGSGVASDLISGASRVKSMLPKPPQRTTTEKTDSSGNSSFTERFHYAQ